MTSRSTPSHRYWNIASTDKQAPSPWLSLPSDYFATDAEVKVPDFFGLARFSDGPLLSQHLQDWHEQLTKLVDLMESGRTSDEHLRECLMAFELAMCARVTQARWLEDRVALLEAQRPKALAWMRSKYRGGV